MGKSPAPDNWPEFRSQSLDEDHVQPGSSLPPPRPTLASFEAINAGSARRLPSSPADSLSIPVIPAAVLRSQGCRFSRTQASLPQLKALLLNRPASQAAFVSSTAGLHLHS